MADQKIVRDKAPKGEKPSSSKREAGKKDEDQSQFTRPSGIEYNTKRVKRVVP